jgi:hypothetical protein
VAGGTKSAGLFLRIPPAKFMIPFENSDNRSMTRCSIILAIRARMLNSPAHSKPAPGDELCPHFVGHRSSLWEAEGNVQTHLYQFVDPVGATVYVKGLVASPETLVPYDESD